MTTLDPAGKGRRQVARGAATVSLAAVAAFLFSPRTGQAQVAIEPALTVDDMIGKSLRVYRTGDPVTLDYREDRLNIELDSDDRIVKVSIG